MHTHIERLAPISLILFASIGWTGCAASHQLIADELVPTTTGDACGVQLRYLSTFSLTGDGRLFVTRLDEQFVAAREETDLVFFDGEGREVEQRSFELSIEAPCMFGGLDASSDTVFGLELCGSAGRLFRLGTEGPELMAELSDVVHWAIDSSDDTLWILGEEGWRTGPLPSSPDAIALAVVDPAPTTLIWGPSSNVDSAEGYLHASRDAFESGMRNTLAIRPPASSADWCQFDVEDVPGVTGRSGVRIIADGLRVWAVTPEGTVAEFVRDESGTEP